MFSNMSIQKLIHCDPIKYELRNWNKHEYFLCIKLQPVLRLTLEKKTAGNT